MSEHKHNVELPAGYTKPLLPGLKRWVAALRSGKYAQGNTFLCTLGPEEPHAYCCLGVLCEIQGRPKSRPSPNAGHMRFDQSSGALSPANPVFAVLGPVGSLPSGVCCLVRRPDSDLRPTAYISLATMNDTGRFTFAEIADVVEQVWADPEDAERASVDAAENEHHQRHDAEPNTRSGLAFTHVPPYTS